MNFGETSISNLSLQYIASGDMTKMWNRMDNGLA